jgi:hypothetical protein
MMVLLWLRKYETYASLALRFGVVEAVISKDIPHLLVAIVVELRTEITWPDANDRDLLRGMIPGFEDAIGYVDGTKQRCYKPTESDAAAAHFSGHIRAYCRTSQVVTAFDGTIIHWSGSNPGSWHDAKTFRESPIGADLDNVLAENEYLIGDKGYVM